jgi:hypothetical protein
MMQQQILADPHDTIRCKVEGCNQPIGRYSDERPIWQIIDEHNKQAHGSR